MSHLGNATDGVKAVTGALTKFIASRAARRAKRGIKIVAHAQQAVETMGPERIPASPAVGKRRTCAAFIWYGLLTAARLSERVRGYAPTLENI